MRADDADADALPAARKAFALSSRNGTVSDAKEASPSASTYLSILTWLQASRTPLPRLPPSSAARNAVATVYDIQQTNCDTITFCDGYNFSEYICQANGKCREYCCKIRSTTNKTRTCKLLLRFRGADRARSHDRIADRRRREAHFITAKGLQKEALC